MVAVSLSLAVTYFLNAVLAFAVVMLVDKIISHEIEAKHAFILAMVAFVVVPLVAPFVGAFERNGLLILSFVSWVILGEVVLRADWQTKLKVLVIAFVVYYILSLFAADTLNTVLRRYLPL